MRPSTRTRAIAPDTRDVAATRLRFLTADGDDAPPIRPLILASWHRSRALDVAADRIELAYQDAIDTDTPLTRSAEPVLTRLSEQLAGQAVSIVLTDPAGVVLSRRTDDSDLERYLDSVRLAPGFSYAEEFVGTNGIGTALEAGSPTEVFGHEHYAENLETLACAGVPIHDPISGRLVGVVDLTCWRKDAESLLLTLARTTAEQIQHALLVSSGMREFEVLQAYRQTCRRTNGIVLAVTSDAVMLNSYAQAELDPADQAALLAHAADESASLPAGRRHSLAVVLPTGAAARMYCQQVGFGTSPAGLVVHVKVEAAETTTQSTGSTRMLLPGLVGDAPLWRRACRQVEQAMTARTWLIVEGETGVGKLALLRAVQLRRQPPGRSAVLDAASAADDPTWIRTVRAALADNDTVIVQHVELLDAQRERALCAVLDEAKRDPDRARLWVAATRRPQADTVVSDRLMAFFPTTVTVPPLRLHIEDLAVLVTHFLGKLGPGGHVTYSPGAIRVLMRSLWPGNVTQLQELLHDVVQRRRSGVITVEDLPPAMHAVSRRVLSPLESMERDAIVRSLADAAGNKVEAARALGMSRATIYRKIHEFGIVAQT